MPVKAPYDSLFERCSESYNILSDFEVAGTKKSIIQILNLYIVHNFRILLNHLAGTAVIFILNVADKNPSAIKLRQKNIFPLNFTIRKINLTDKRI